MSVPSNQPLRFGPPGAEIPLICPATGHRLHAGENEALSVDSSGAVVQRWKKENGFFDLVVGDRFEDETDSDCRCYEVESNKYSTEHYWIPLFQRLFPDYATTKRRLLAIGCGIGVEVDLLCEAGFACFGVDNGNRTVDWPQRTNPHGLLLANAMHLPFEDKTFDAVFCGCVFPHVGVIGDSNRVAPTYAEDRQQLASEMVRVTRPEGRVVACSPNRHFPFDIFHGRKPGSYVPRFNPPGSPFLLSISDYRRMFTLAGCRTVSSLPVEGFWGFVTMQRSLKGRLLSAPIRASFALSSTEAFSFLRPTCFVPWVAVQARV